MLEQVFHTTTRDLQTGKIVEEEYRRKFRLHRDPKDGPAKIERFLEGGLWRVHWYVNGAYHRLDGPAFLCWQKPNKPVVHWEGKNVPAPYMELYYQHGRLHRDPHQGPAFIYRREKAQKLESVAYFVHGLRYRDPLEGPYEIDYDERERVKRELFVPRKKALGHLPSRNAIKRAFPQGLPDL